MEHTLPLDGRLRTSRPQCPGKLPRRQAQHVAHLLLCSDHTAPSLGGTWDLQTDVASPACGYAGVGPAPCSQGHVSGIWTGSSPAALPGSRGPSGGPSPQALGPVDAGVWVPAARPPALPPRNLSPRWCFPAHLHGWPQPRGGPVGHTETSVGSDYPRKECGWSGVIPDGPQRGPRESQPPVPGVLLMFILSCYQESYLKQHFRGNGLPRGLFHIVVGPGKAPEGQG